MIAPTLESGCTMIEVSNFSYDAAENRNGSRRQVSTRLMSEDNHLDKSKRKKTVASARDMWRNFALCAWAIRRHLDYTTKFTFQCRTPDKEFNKLVEKEIKKLGKRKKFDIAKRHNLNRFVRIAETRSICDHDVGIVKLNTGHLQAIEGDRIQNPPKPGKNEIWTQGVCTNSAGEALKFGVFNRGKRGKGYEYARTIPARNLWLHGQYDRFDQYRGVSPLVSAIDSMRDVYEGIDFGLAKLKVEQMFAMAVTRDAVKGPGGLPGEGDEKDPDGYSVNLDGRMIFMDMDRGDNLKFLKSDAPGSNMVDFLQAVIMIAIKSLDIPYSFFDESHTNFFGSRAAWLHYERGCRDKRERISEMLEWWTQWALTRLILEGKIKLPAGMSVEDEFWEWVPDGMPWWDPVKEINGDVMAIKAGFTTPQKVVKERGGGDYFDNIEETAAAAKFAKDKGFEVEWAPFQELVLAGAN